MNTIGSTNRISESNSRMTTNMWAQTRNGKMIIEQNHRLNSDLTHSYKNLLNRNSHMTVSGNLKGHQCHKESLIEIPETQKSSIAL
jgi:ABC-type cobalamin transport system ATPase subunit